MKYFWLLNLFAATICLAGCFNSFFNRHKFSNPLDYINLVLGLLNLFIVINNFVKRHKLKRKERDLIKMIDEL